MKLFFLDFFSWIGVVHHRLGRLGEGSVCEMREIVAPAC